MRIEARIGVDDAAVASNEQPGPSEEEHGERDLGGDEQPSQPLVAGGGPAGRPAAVFQSVVQVDTGSAKCGEHAEGKPRHDRHDGGKRQNPGVESYFRESRERSGAESPERRNAGVPEDQARGASRRGEHEALGEQLAYHAATIRADGRSDCDLLLPARRPREEQVRDVGTRREQDESHRGQEYAERNAHLAHDLLEERDGADRETAIRGIGLRIPRFHARGDDVEL